MSTRQYIRERDLRKRSRDALDYFVLGIGIEKSRAESVFGVSDSDFHLDG